MLQRIIAGGHDGVERAALDAAIHAGIPCGGWVPAQPSPPEGYPLTILEKADLREAAQRNIREADGTLFILRGTPPKGSFVDVIRHDTLRYRKQLLHVDINALGNLQDATPLISAWVRMQHIHRLLVTGPDDSTPPELYADAKGILAFALRSCI